MTDIDLLSEVQAAVLEPRDGGQTWPSARWTKTEVVALLTQRQDRFLKETLLLASINILPVLSGATSVDLPDDWMITYHAAWRSADGAFQPLHPADATTADLGEPTWLSAPGTPVVWSDGDTPVPTLRLMPTPDADGQVWLIYAARGEAPAGDPLSPTLLTTPDDFCVFLRYGVLADLFGKQGRMFDPLRAAACEAKYREGIDLAQRQVQGWL